MCRRVRMLTNVVFFSAQLSLRSRNLSVFAECEFWSRNDVISTEEVVYEEVQHNRTQNIVCKCTVTWYNEHRKYR